MKELADLVDCFGFLVEYFDGDQEKATKWMNTPNIFFGNKIPASMVVTGRGDRVLEFLKNAYKF